MPSSFQRLAPWLLAWLAAALIGALLLARAELTALREAFETDARIAHRLLSQRVVQHDAVLATLALLGGSALLVALLRLGQEACRSRLEMKSLVRSASVAHRAVIWTNSAPWPASTRSRTCSSKPALPAPRLSVMRPAFTNSLPGRSRLPHLLLAALCALGALSAGPATAQVAPSAQQAAAYTGLHGAAHRGDTAALEKLIAARADLNARDAYGRTPVHVATFARQRDALRTLSKAGAQLELLENDRYDAVTIAAVADDDETLRVLLGLGASAKLTTSRYDGTALIAAAHLGHDGVVKQLIAAGAPLDHVNNLHWTALIEAVVLGDGGPRHQEVVRALLAAGASTRLADRQGNSPLTLAKARGYQVMVQLLEQAGAK